MPRNAPVPPPFVQTVGSEAPYGTILPSAAYPSAAGGVTNSAEMVNFDWRGVRLYINTTSVGAGGTVVAKIQVRDPASLNWADLPLAVTGTINSNTTTTLTVHPGIAETTNVDISDPLGLRWRVVITVGTNNVTLSVSGDYIA
jgi:hypothetical protein